MEPENNMAFNILGYGGKENAIKHNQQNVKDMDYTTFNKNIAASYAQDDIGRYEEEQEIKNTIESVVGHSVNLKTPETAENAFQEYLSHAIVGYDDSSAGSGANPIPKYDSKAEAFINKARQLLFGGKKVFRNKMFYDPSKLKAEDSLKTVAKRGTAGMYSDAKGKAEKYSNKKLSNGLTYEQGVEALSSDKQGVDDSFLQNIQSEEEARKLLILAYQKNNQLPNDPYAGAISKIAGKLQSFYNNCESVQDCINFENMIVHCIRTADASGGRYVDNTRYLGISQHIRKLRAMLTPQNGGSGEGNKYVAKIGPSGNVEEY